MYTRQSQEQREERQGYLQDKHKDDQRGYLKDNEKGYLKDNRRGYLKDKD